MRCQLAACIIFLCTPAWAGSIINPSALPLTNAVQRFDFAVAIRSNLVEILNQIPNLKPKEEEWVEKEQSRIYAIADAVVQQRESIKLLKSRESAIHSAKRTFSPVIARLDLVILHASEGTNSATPARNELLAWLALSDALAESNLSNLIARLSNHDISGVSWFIRIGNPGSPGGLPRIGDPEHLLILAINQFVLKPFIARVPADYL